MSKMRSDRRPPLAKSPFRLRPRHPLQPTATSLQTPPGSFTKSPSDFEEPELRPEYRTLSCELRALENMVRAQLGVEKAENAGESNNPVISVNSNWLYERGRFYDVYSARRNERLKRKKAETNAIENKTPNNLGVRVESSKRYSCSKKKIESLRKSVWAAYSSVETPRYMLRSMTKENKKPPPLPVNSAKSSVAVPVGGDRKIGTRRSRRSEYFGTQIMNSGTS